MRCLVWPVLAAHLLLPTLRRTNAWSQDAVNIQPSGSIQSYWGSSMETERRYLVAFDYVILAVTLVLSLGIGLFYAFKSRNAQTTSEYLMGSRQFSIIPVALSLIASFISSIALIGFPAETYFYGAQVAFTSVGKIGGALLTMALFIPLLHPLRITSAQEYLELRYNSVLLRRAGAICSIIYQLSYSGCVVYGQAATLEATTGLPSWISIILVIVLGTIYTTVGGFRAVIWTDVLQVVVMLTSLLVTIIAGLISVGGFSETWRINKEWDRLYLDVSPTPYHRLTLWSMSVGGTFYWLATLGISQASVQRFSAISDLSRAQGSMVTNFLGTTLFGLLCTFVGMVAFAYYTKLGCDPYKAGHIPNTNHILPYFVLNGNRIPGLPGLFVSGLFCGSLSTLSSCINCTCAVVWEDFLRPVLGKLPSEKQVRVNQLMAILFGCLCLAMTFLIYGVGGGSLYQMALSFNGLVCGPLLGIFMLGPLVPWSNWKGAICGGLVSLALNLWIFTGQVVTKATQRTVLDAPSDGCFTNYTESIYSSTTIVSAYSTDNYKNTTLTDIEHRSGLGWLYSVSFMWFSLIGCAVCLIVGALSSVALGPSKPADVPKKYLFTFIRSFGKDEDGKEIHETETSEQLL